MNVKTFMIYFLIMMAVLIFYDTRQQTRIRELERIIELQRYQLYQSQPAESREVNPIIVQQTGQPEITIEQQPASQPEVIVINQALSQTTASQPEISQPPADQPASQPEISQPAAIPTLQPFNIQPPGTNAEQGVMAANLTSVSEIYATAKQILVDLGLWQVGQAAIGVLVVISFAFAILSWFRA